MKGEDKTDHGDGKIDNGDAKTDPGDDENEDGEACTFGDLIDGGGEHGNVKISVYYYLQRRNRG
ncbi:hypothetical protein FA10DRAFT_268640 [Acaromyces ingoldii]|uniref:Uncharacterized protein n=1 Tax=Acaromyces ingoldii TaxID=215250 RepID=A0A316YH93_9BASI|nr:hypothetical protein FA10DRAFT_268640 [Acaromyces ingoldii]PWN88446.1 hypothetical protein FA10DRAFT_268640 [Acaromyces ingoldii]